MQQFLVCRVLLQNSHTERSHPGTAFRPQYRGQVWTQVNLLLVLRSLPHFLIRIIGSRVPPTFFCSPSHHGTHMAWQALSWFNFHSRFLPAKPSPLLHLRFSHFKWYFIGILANLLRSNIERLLSYVSHLLGLDFLYFLLYDAVST